jgi:hypothetical protein
MTGDPHLFRAGPQIRDFSQCLLHFAFGANNPNQILHRFLQVVLNLVWVLAGGAAIEGLESSRSCCLKLLLINRGFPFIALREFRGKPPGAPSEDTRSESELPPSRLAPCSPAAASPAANNPGTFDICESPSTRTPPIM